MGATVMARRGKASPPGVCTTVQYDLLQASQLGPLKALSDIETCRDKNLGNCSVPCGHRKRSRDRHTAHAPDSLVKGLICAHMDSEGSRVV